MLFSILMANYNNARFLQESIRSVIEQTYPQWELVLVDDGSTDDFEKIILAYSDDPRIRIFRNIENRGTATTKALCVEYARGDVAGYLDPDDSLDPRTLAIMVEAHLAHPGCSIVHSTNYICEPDLSVIKISECPKPLPENTPYLFVGDGSIHHFVSFKVESYHRSAGLEKTRLHDRASDQELYYLLEEHGDVHFIDQPLHYYRIHKGSISNMGNEEATLNQHYLIIQKACLRRIQRLRNSDQPGSASLVKRYRTRYRKIRTLYCFRNKQWFGFAANLLLFSVGGGMRNLTKYMLKLPKERRGLLTRTFTENYNATK